MNDRLDLRPATAALAAVVRGVRDDQLDAPTPCEESSVADLLDHVAGLSLAFTAAARKERLPGGATPRASGADLDDDWRDSIPARLQALGEAWQDPTAYDGTTQAGPIEMPAAAAALVTLDEVTVHAWDLARATGQPFDPEPDAVEACASFVESFDAPRDGSMFGPVVPVADDASALDRLIGATGRDPHWAP